MLNKKPIPWFAGSLVLAILGFMTFATYGLAQDATDDAASPPADTTPAEASDPVPTWADAGDSGDTAWMITAAVLVLFMTIPGLSLFYGGLVRSKNYLSILVQCFAITCVMSFLWIAYGYGWSAEGGGKYFGDFKNRVFLDGYTADNMSGPADTIPESVWICEPGRPSS